ncbi:MAG: hypothetical protein IPJ09_06075 [Saprospiraceae bacterium]|nr:hypothetical protein [Saprospiraceae bacterium]
MNLYKPSIIALTWMLAIGTLTGQTFKAYVKAADDAFLTKDYYSSLVYNLNALEFDSTRIERMHAAAEAARNLNSYKVAELYYQKVVDADKKDAYSLDKYHLAAMKQAQGKYEEAIAGYNMYLAENRNEDVYYTQRADKEVKASQWATQQVAQTSEAVKVTRLGDEINTPYSEFGASQKGDTLIYSSMRFELPAEKAVPKRTYSNVLLSINGQANDGFSSINNPLGHTANTAINTLNNRMYFTLCENLNDADIRCDLYYRDYTNSSFGEAIKIPEPINQPGFTTTQPNIAFDSKNNHEVLYWVSDRPGGKGKLDIWSADINADGTFGIPQNLVAINTAENDITPFFQNNLGELYFSSDGRIGMGGYDVYKAIFKNGAFLEAEHIDPPINTSYNDIYYTISADGKKGLMSSNRVGSSYLDALQEACCYDIYSIEAEPTKIDLLVSTFDKNTLEDLLGATVRLKNLTDPGAEDILVTLHDLNDFNFPLERNKEYLVIAEKEGYRPDSTNVSTYGLNRSQKIEKKLYLETDKIDLNAFTFDAKTKQALQGAEVTLIDLTDSTIVSKINLDANDFHFPLIRGHQYRIIANKKGYNPATVMIDTRDVKANTITENLYMEIGDIYSFLPLILFFDNDQPDIRSYKPRTDRLYSETFPPYYARKEEFKDQWASKLKQEEIPISDQAYETFFNDRLAKGNNDLSKFLDILISMLQRGDKFEIFLKGYASPRASEKYNLILGQRRIFSVKNEFLKYRDGILSNFLNNKQLTISEKSFGELTAPKKVPDILRDTRLSVFSLDASQERRVEIVDIKSNK